jgi:hypothetical protein
MDTLRNVARYAGIFLLAVLTAIAVDGVLHLVGRPGWGRYLGYWGAGLIVLSFLHSLRKRRKFSFGSARLFLSLHELLAWLGATMLLVHAGIHFNALLPWLALAAMLINVASGLTGKFLLQKSKTALADRRKVLAAGGLAGKALEDAIHWDALVVGLMQKWRKVHLPITMAFGLLALLHIVSVMMFWRW